MNKHLQIVFLVFLALSTLMESQLVGADKENRQDPETVLVHSGPLTLRGLVWYPSGTGTFPAILFNHGRGCTPQPHCDSREAFIRDLGPLFSRHGYVFLALFRRGEGLSAEQGESADEQLQRARENDGQDKANALQLHLLDGEQLEDARAGVAYLQGSSLVDSQRIGIVGHSFGGSLALVLAERDKSVKVVVCFGAAAESWQRSPMLRQRLTSAAGRLQVPVLFVYASNDYSVLPGQALSAEMKTKGKVYKLAIFPALGAGAEEGHNLIYKGTGNWEKTVFPFLDNYLKP